MSWRVRGTTRDAKMNERHPVVISRAHSAVKRAVLRKGDISSESGLRSSATPRVLSPVATKTILAVTASTERRASGAGSECILRSNARTPVLGPRVFRMAPTTTKNASPRTRGNGVR